jgi:hypothetical protein
METEYITAAEMRTRLRAAFRADPEKSLLAVLARRLRDPAAPWPESRRPHPLWLTLALLAGFALCVFVGFTLLRL